MSTVPKELREYFDMADVDENNQRGTIGNNQHQGFSHLNLFRDQEAGGSNPLTPTKTLTYPRFIPENLKH